MAVINSVTRPWLGESAQWRYVAGGLENAVLLLLMVGAMLAAWYRKSGRLPFALGLALAIQCLALAVLLGLSTPNLGSLSRYRSELLPFLLLLLLQNDYAAALLGRLGIGQRK
jgi:MFS-type transporter involved in bile tolerance (Atg22 family)